MNKDVLARIEAESYVEDMQTFTDISGAQSEVSIILFSRKKFTELIVKECADVADRNYDSGFCPVGGFIKEHFGVE